jgi:hypothetical protein
VTVDDTADLSGPPIDTGPAWHRLEEQLAWHDRKASWNQKSYRTIKVAELIAAAAIPVVAAAGAPGWLTGGLGALVVVMEGINQLFRFHDSWINYRSTSEALTREKYLYLSQARPYDRHTRPQALLAQRVEDILGREHAHWATTMSQEGRDRKSVV